ncbi:MAG: carbamate kinase [Oscillospiraceae bacterium]
MKKVVIALGGNALQKPGEPATSENEQKNILVTAEHISEIIKNGYKVIVTHGNGPQVGRILLQNEAAKEITPPMPMDVCGAMTQGMIGYHIQQGLSNVLSSKGLVKPVCTVVTQVEVCRDDPAFQNPSKPVGAFYTEAEAQKLVDEKGYAMKKDANRGYRRVVPSPLPRNVVEIDTIKMLVDNDVVVVTVGGGGIPVVKENGEFVGVEAVIDKDFASEVIAEQLDADILMILTEVESACINFGTENSQALHRVTVDEMIKHAEDGQFAPGSMLPKVQAIIKFVQSKPNRIAIITSLESALAGLAGEKGTIVFSNSTKG